VRKGFRKEFDGDTTSQFGVGGLIHLAHSACSQVAGDLVMCELCSDHDLRKETERSLTEHPQFTQGFRAWVKTNVARKLKLASNRDPVLLQLNRNQKVRFSRAEYVGRVQPRRILC